MWSNRDEITRLEDLMEATDSARLKHLVELEDKVAFLEEVQSRILEELNLTVKRRYYGGDITETKLVKKCPTCKGKGYNCNDSVSKDEYTCMNW